jgi:ParB family chromosome partitioning protein
LPKRDMNDLLKKRMSATQQAAEIVVGDEAYETLFRGAPAPEASRFCDLPIERLRPFFTADIGFRPYPPEKLKAFSQQLAEQGIYERVIVRPISGSNDYEILAGHNRTKAWQMSGHDMIPAEVVSADDARAVSIAVATNLLRRQDLTIIERGKAYRALLRENNRHGQWDANQAETTFGDSRQKLQEGDTDSTFGENRQRYNARKLVADFFGVTEYEIRKAIKLASLIGPLADILEDTPRKLPIACAELIADYDAATQQAFVEMCSIEGYTLNKAAVQKITRTCPPPSAGKQEIYAVWRQARAEEAQRRTAPPKKISFDRRKFAPYLEKLGSDKELEELFLAFLRQRVG